MSTPFVSIVITNYNYSRFLGDAVRSALSQTHGNLEVILVDDGSTDNSLEIARQFPIQVISQENHGVCHARSIGARASTGEYLMFLDSDDILEPTYVEHCLQALEKAPSDVAYAYSGMRYFGLKEGIFPSMEFSAKALLRGNYIHVSALMRRDHYDQVGGYNPRWKRIEEDYELWIRMLRRGFKGVLVPEPLLQYRRHENSRNMIPDPQLAELRWHIRFTYPLLFWRKLLKDPLRTLYFFGKYNPLTHR
jgi:glycosyltransferase involved in cell wall biosynthesis